MLYGATGEARTRTMLPLTDFLTAYSYVFLYHSYRACCLEHVFTISFDLGSGSMFSTHLQIIKEVILPSPQLVSVTQLLICLII